MKTKNLFIAIFLVTFLTTTAQITKGNWMVGGSGNISSYETKYYNNNVEVVNTGLGINISPNIGFFFFDNFVAGLDLNFGYTNPKNYNSSSGFGVGPFVRYYFLKQESRVNLLAHLEYTYGANKTKGDNNKSHSNSYGIKVGPVIYFNSSVGIEMTLDYNSSKLIPENSTNSSYKNLQIGIGFQIHLEK